MAQGLLQKLESYASSDYYPLHMPGHKRRTAHFYDPFAIDITEIEGFDNLHHAQGILKEAQQRAARLFGAEESYFLINGSTCGLLAAISASVRRGGRILMARNCHKAAYHAVFLNGLHVTYLYPEMCGGVIPGAGGVLSGAAGMDDCSGKRDCSSVMSGAAGMDGCGGKKESGSGISGAAGAGCVGGIAGSIRPEAVEKALKEQKDIEAVLITSPTYDGVVSDIRTIAAMVHRAGAVLIVDAAHGSHFGMHPYFPESPIACGADIVINSLHKTLPSLTQTALLHVCGPAADRGRIRKYLSIYQSSSPSYVLMAGMDACVTLLEQQGSQLFCEFVQRLERLRDELKGMQVFHLISGTEAGLYTYDFDRSRILISTEGSMTGPELSSILRERYHMEPEMETETCMTAIMTICDTQEGFERLSAALRETDSAAAEHFGRNDAGSPDKAEPDRDSAVAESSETAEHFGQNGADAEAIRPVERMTIEEAESSRTESVPLREAPGRIAAEYAYIYPPGIPLIVPGERIPEALPVILERYRRIGLQVQGPEDDTGKTFFVVR